MSYPQDPNNPYGQPEQNPYGQGAPNQNPYAQPGQNPYGQPPAQPQPGGLYDSGGQAPFSQSGQNPYGQPGNPYDPNSAAPTQIYGQPGNPYGPPNPFDASGGQIPQQQPFGQPQQPYGVPGYPQQQPFYGAQPPAKSNNGMIIGIVVAAVVVLGAGGYFLASSHKNNPPSPVVASLPTGQPSGGPTAGPSGSPAATGSGGGALGSFSPPSTYSSNALEDDPGCGDFAGGEADFLTSSFDLSSTSEANSAFDKLAAETTTAASDAQDKTLQAAFTAEAAYIKANEAALSAGMVAYSNSPDLSTTQFSQAYNPLKPTDEYINGVCGLASWSPTEP